MVGAKHVGQPPVASQLMVPEKEVFATPLQTLPASVPSGWVPFSRTWTVTVTTPGPPQLNVGLAAVELENTPPAPPVAVHWIEVGAGPTVATLS